MRHLTTQCIAGILFASLCAPRAISAAEPLAVITPSAASVGQLSREQAAQLFLRQEPIPDNLRELKPFDRTEESLRKQFYQNIAGMSLQRLRAYWAKRVFTGRGRPPETLDASQIEEQLSRDPATLTYVPESQRPNDSKKVLSLE